MTVLRRCVGAAATVGVAAAIAACGSSSSNASSGGSGSGPVTIGTSLSLSGDFAADGQAFQRGYQLWAADQNAKGGLLGRKVKRNIMTSKAADRGTGASEQIEFTSGPAT